MKKCGFAKNAFKIFVTRAANRTLYILDDCDFVNFTNSRKSFSTDIFEGNKQVNNSKETKNKFFEADLTEYPLNRFELTKIKKSKVQLVSK